MNLHCTYNIDTIIIRGYSTHFRCPAINHRHIEKFLDASQYCFTTSVLLSSALAIPTGILVAIGPSCSSYVRGVLLFIELCPRSNRYIFTSRTIIFFSHPHFFSHVSTQSNWTLLFFHYFYFILFIYFFFVQNLITTPR